MTAVALALFGAALFAVSAAVQQRAAQRAAPQVPGRAPPIRVILLVARLARDRWWVFGWVLNVAAFGAHAAALHLGSLTTVQSLLVSQLLFAMLTLRRPPVRAWLGTIAVCAGLALLVFARPSAPPSIRRAEVPPAVLVGVAAAVALIVLAHVLPARTQTRLRGALAGAAAGVCCCLTAVFVVLVTDTLAHGGVGALARDWSILALAASTAASGLLTQDAFAAGSLPTALTAISIADPVSSALFDATVFHAGWAQAAWWPWSGVAVGALLVTGVLLLARRRAPDPRGHTDGLGPRGHADGTTPARNPSNTASSPSTVADHGNSSATARASA
jgi:hypothetical protein